MTHTRQRERTTRQLQGLVRAVRAVSASLEQSEVLETIVREAALVMEVGACTLKLLDPTGEHLFWAADVGIPAEWRERPLSRRGEGLVGWVAVKGEPLAVLEPLIDPRVMSQDFWTRFGFASYLGVPVKEGERTIGVLSFCTREPHRFTEDEIALALSFADQAAIALRNARLYEETERRRREAEELAEVARTLTESLDVKAVAGRIVDGVRRLLDVADATVYQLQDERSLLALAVSGGAGLRQAGFLLPVGTGVAGQAVVSGEPVFSTNILHDPKIVLAEVHQQLAPLGDRSVLAIPLRSKGEMIGALSLSGQVGRVFTEAEVSLLQTFGDQAALALENARLFEETERGARELATLYAVTASANQTLELGTVCEEVFQKVKEMFHFDEGRIYLFTAERDELRLQASFDSGKSAWRPPEVFKPGQGNVGRVATIEQPMIYENTQNDPHYREATHSGAMLKSGFSFFAAFPIKAKLKTVGVMVCVGQSPRRLTPDETRLLTAIGNQIGVAVEKARLIDELKTLTQELGRKNRELDVFVYTVTHDLKAPLVTLQGIAELLLEGHGSAIDEKGQHYLRRLKANAQQMERLILDLLALSRIGREGRPSSAVPLGEVMEDVLLEWGEAIKTRGITLTAHDLPTLWGVRTQIEQIMSNLVGNAIKYLGEPGEPSIEVGAQDDGGPMVECYVRDNGIGIDPAYHEKVFEIFQRLKDTEVEGTGVGLAIVKKIVDGAGGRIWVESAKGQGSTFRFTWPKADGEAHDRAGD